MMPTNEYVEVHNGGYYVAGTRIGLDVVAYDFRRRTVGGGNFRSLSLDRFTGEGLWRYHVHLGAPSRS